MQHAHHLHSPAHAQAPHGTPDESLNRVAFVATLHCLLGCAIGEVSGLIIGNAMGWSNGQTVFLAVVLAFISGFALTAIPFLRRGYSWPAALRVALAADAASITIMEVVDNAIMLFIPGAMDASVLSLHFWASMAGALAVAGVVAFPVNRWLIGRGRGHAIVHAHH